MKKLTSQVKSEPPRHVKRADIAPAIGFAIVVDGCFKTEFDDEKAAERAAAELRTKYPTLKIEIYDASSKARSLAK